MVKVVITKDLITPACGDHPDLLIAKKGEIAEITGTKSHWPHHLKLSNGNIIGCQGDEFKPFRLIIAGSRTLKDRTLTITTIWTGLSHLGLQVSDISEIVSGKCPTGADKFGEDFANEVGLPIKPFEPDWSKGPRGGPERNAKMAAYATHLILIWDGKSRGSKSMLAEATKRNLKIYQHIITG